MRSVTFITSCWERDWDILLKTKFLLNKIQRNQYAFTSKVLAINNVKNRAKVEKHAEKAVANGIITNYFFVEDCIDDTLDFFPVN